MDTKSLSPANREAVVKDLFRAQESLGILLYKVFGIMGSEGWDVKYMSFEQHVREAKEQIENAIGALDDSYK